jgi:hypothetical protein
MADNTFVNIGGHKVSAGQKYSTTEVKTGDVWIDGKPIYRRTWNIPASSITASTNNHRKECYYNFSNVDRTMIDTVVNAEGVVNFDYGGYNRTITLGEMSCGTDMSTWYNFVFHHTDSWMQSALQVYVSSSTDTTQIVNYIHITIYYTKTSD